MSDKKEPLAPCPFCPKEPRMSVDGVAKCSQHTHWMSVAEWNRRAPSPRMETRQALEKIAKKNSRGYTYDRDEAYNIAVNALAALDKEAVN